LMLNSLDRKMLAGNRSCQPTFVASLQPN